MTSVPKLCDFCLMGECVDCTDNDSCQCECLEPTIKGDSMKQYAEKHTPTPWEVCSTSFERKSDPLFWVMGIKKGGLRVAEASGVGREQCEANAEFICRAVNNHEALLEACKEALDILVKNACNPDVFKVCEQLKEVIKQAEGKQ